MVLEVTVDKKANVEKSIEGTSVMIEIVVEKEIGVECEKEVRHPEGITEDIKAKT